VRWPQSKVFGQFAQGKTDVETIIGFVRSGRALHDAYGF